MSSSQTYQLMTKYRYALFGFAILWIFFRHTFYYNQISYSVFTSIVSIGDCGVDIFLFLSGFGLVFSYKKCQSNIEFYKKRVLRIFPIVLFLFSVFAIVKDIIQGNNPTTIIHPSYWFYAIYSNYWFIGAIIVFYILFPFIYYCVKRSIYATLSMSLLLSVVGIVIVHTLNVSFFNQLVVYFARIPVFVMGVAFAHNQNLLCHRKELFLLMVCSIPCLIFLQKDYQRLAYFPLAIFISVVLPQIMAKFPTFIIKCFECLGKISLEFYLIHVFLFGIGIINYIAQELNVNIYVSVILTFGIVLIMSLLVFVFISKIIKRQNQ